MATSLSTSGPPSNTCTQPKRHLNRFSRFWTDDCRLSLYFTIYGSLDPPESSTQTASRPVQPCLQVSLVRQTDLPTDHATLSLTTGRIYVHSTVTRLNNTITVCNCCIHWIYTTKNTITSKKLTTTHNWTLVVHNTAAQNISVSSTLSLPRYCTMQRRGYSITQHTCQ